MPSSRKSLKNLAIFNPRASNEWSKDESKFGQKMLEKMGWKQGQGLGLNNQGMTENIKVRFKLDNKGLGYQIKEDHWLEVRHEFSNLLSQLSQTSENEDDAFAKEKKSLEAVSQSSKTRVHYHKFTHGKDIARYKKEDLVGILGKKEDEESKVLDSNSRKPKKSKKKLLSTSEIEDSRKDESCKETLENHSVTGRRNGTEIHGQSNDCNHSNSCEENKLVENLYDEYGTKKLSENKFEEKPVHCHTEELGGNEPNDFSVTHHEKNVMDYKACSKIKDYISNFERNHDELMSKYREKYKLKYSSLSSSSSRKIVVYGDEFDGRKLDCKKLESNDVSVVPTKLYKNMSKAEKITTKTRLLKRLKDNIITHNFEGSNLTNISGYGSGIID